MGRREREERINPTEIKREVRENRQRVRTLLTSLTR